ncbi:uncharacterized protein LOC121850278 [Callorhinchus milii]|uniref:uncharacterized protein LOC121850278 n=1 Tax=Callorhinchus milii TaxID=7868 RepID=UPI001C3F79A5|nr:uncharacterized protein LOC121850278 [Callorhinchus milii]
MDFATFRALNPEEVKNLTAEDLKGLLGAHLPALKTGFNDTVVKVWVNSHFESEVRKVGLTGGIPDPPLETVLCEARNSSEVNDFLTTLNRTQLCSIAIVDYACARIDLLANLTSYDVTVLFDCFTGSKALKISDEKALLVFIQKLDRTTLNQALDMFNNKTSNISSIPLETKTTFFNALWENVKPNITGPAFLSKWFQQRFRPIIAGIPQSVLSDLLVRNVTCDGYQAVVKGLSNGFGEMTATTRQSILQVWILSYLNGTGAGCISNTNGSRDWLVKNWGQFSKLAQIRDLSNLNSNFSAVAAAGLLTVSQLGEAVGRNGTLENASDVRKVFTTITNGTVTEFIDVFAAAAHMLIPNLLQNNVGLK